MKLIRLLLLLAGLSTCDVFSQDFRSNCPVFPQANTRIMPDGNTITLTAIGNEAVSYLETIEGYTVLETGDGYYEYATNNSNGELVKSGVRALGKTTPLQKNLKLHARYSTSQLNALTAIFDQQGQVLNKKAGGKPFPPKGNRKLLTILVQYPDLQATINKENFDSLMIKPNYTGTGSFRDYYLKASFNQLDIHSDVFGWYMADSGYLYYAKSNSAYMSHVGKLIKKAILSADSAGVDFSQYDNDKDGYVDGIIILHSGIGAEEQSAPLPNNHIWSHRSNLANTSNSVLVDGVTVDAYGCFPEKRYNSGSYSQVGIGVITHEFGHLLDLPDLYATNQNSEGSGNYSNMAGGPWLNNERTPCMHDAWTRIQMGWMAPTVINSIGTYTIPKSLADSNFCFKIVTSQVNEYFLLENRQKKGFDKYLPSKGLAVWHINSSKAKLLTQGGSNNVNNDTSNYGVGLIQADGLYHLEKGTNRGDAGDLYPGSTNNHNLNTQTLPSTALYYKVAGVRQVSNVVLSNITQNPDSSITFTFGNKPSAGFTPSVTTGCAPLTVAFENGSAFSNNFLWRFDDGSSSTSKNEARTYEKAGTYPVTLVILDSANNQVDSVTQTIKVEASPKAAYTLTRGDSNVFTLKSNSTGHLYVTWRFGTNQTSTANEPVYTLITPGKLPFMLIAYTQNMCTDTARGELDYWPNGINEQGILTKVNCYPNPFKNTFTLDLELVSANQVNIGLYNILGAKQADLFSGRLESGSHSLILDAATTPPGLYLLEVKGLNFKKILRLVHQ